MNKKAKQTKPSAKNLLLRLLVLKQYLYLILLLFFIVIYSLVLLKIRLYSNEQPSAIAISADMKTTSQPVINQHVVKQLESMQNNSVSVKALFNQTRQNPFQ